MKVFLILILLPVFLLLAGCSTEGQSLSEAEIASNLAVSRAATQKLGGALKSALQEAVSAGGPLEAVNVCHEEAAVIAGRISEDEGLQVGRTSRKFRNPANAPDAWETAGLEAFDARIAAGEKPGEVDMWAVVPGSAGGRTFRYLKAIPTAPLCLTCHGESLSPDLEALLAGAYPDDKAVGFSVGELRGAFSVQFELPRAEKTGG